MKKTIVSVMLVLIAFGINAQDVKGIKKAFDKGDVMGAKTQIDAFVAANPTKPEGLFLKAKIYESIASNEKLSPTVPDAGQVAFDAFKKGMDNVNNNKEVALEMVTNRNTFYTPVINLYTDFYKLGLKDFNAGVASKNPRDYQAAVDAFTMANTIGAFSIQNKISTLGVIDTTLVLNIGQAAINANNTSVAVANFKLLADANITGTAQGKDGYQLPYEWLAQYYRDQKDETNFLTYVNKGKQYFPNDKFFDLVSVDYYRNKKDYSTMFQKYDDLMTKNPDSLTYSLNYATEAFSYIYGSDEGVKIENKDKLMDNIHSRVDKILKVEPNNMKANWLMGQYYYNLGVETAQQAAKIKAPKLPADIKTKADLNASSKQLVNQSIPYFEKSISQLEMTNKKSDKSTYKTIVNIISQAYEVLQQSDKVKFYQAKYDAADAKFVN